MAYSLISERKMWNKLSRWDKALFIVIILFGISQIFAYQQDLKMDALEAELNEGATEG